LFIVLSRGRSVRQPVAFRTDERLTGSSLRATSANFQPQIELRDPYLHPVRQVEEWAASPAIRKQPRRKRETVRRLMRSTENQVASKSRVFVRRKVNDFLFKPSSPTFAEPRESPRSRKQRTLFEAASGNRLAATSGPEGSKPPLNQHLEAPRSEGSPSAV
jgi:hypothetical protein